MYRGRRFLTAEGKSSKEAIALEASLQYRGQPLEGDVVVTVRFYFPNMRKDIDNALKGLFDCLSGILWQDDKQITELHVYKIHDKVNPRTEVTIA